MTCRQWAKNETMSVAEKPRKLQQRDRVKLPSHLDHVKWLYECRGGILQDRGRHVPRLQILAAGSFLRSTHKIKDEDLVNMPVQVKHRLWHRAKQADLASLRVWQLLASVTHRDEWPRKVYMCSSYDSDYPHRDQMLSFLTGLNPTGLEWCVNLELCLPRLSAAALLAMSRMPNLTSLSLLAESSERTGSTLSLDSDQDRLLHLMTAQARDNAGFSSLHTLTLRRHQAPRQTLMESLDHFKHLEVINLIDIAERDQTLSDNWQLVSSYSQRKSGVPTMSLCFTDDSRKYHAISTAYTEQEGTEGPQARQTTYVRDKAASPRRSIAVPLEQTHKRQVKARMRKAVEIQLSELAP